MLLLLWCFELFITWVTGKKPYSTCLQQWQSNQLSVMFNSSWWYLLTLPLFLCSSYHRNNCEYCMGYACYIMLSIYVLAAYLNSGDFKNPQRLHAFDCLCVNWITIWSFKTQLSQLRYKTHCAHLDYVPGDPGYSLAIASKKGLFAAQGLFSVSWHCAMVHCAIVWHWAFFFCVCYPYLISCPWKPLR